MLNIEVKILTLKCEAASRSAPFSRGWAFHQKGLIVSLECFYEIHFRFQNLKAKRDLMKNQNIEKLEAQPFSPSSKTKKRFRIFVRYLFRFRFYKINICHRLPAVFKKKSKQEEDKKVESKSCFV